MEGRYPKGSLKKKENKSFSESPIANSFLALQLFKKPQLPKLCDSLVAEPGNFILEIR